MSFPADRLARVATPDEVTQLAEFYDALPVAGQQALDAQVASLSDTGVRELIDTRLQPASPAATQEAAAEESAELPPKPLGDAKQPPPQDAGSAKDK